MEKRTPMGGWKTKLGAFLVAIATTIGGSAQLLPIPEAAPWITFAAFIVGGIGGAFTIWGIAHKMEKNRPVVIEKKRIPYFIQPMSPDEFKFLETLRKKKEVEPPGAA
jgi:hypothetical protein